MVQVIWAQVTPACQTCNRSLHFALLIYKSDKKKKEKTNRLGRKHREWFQRRGGLQAERKNQSSHAQHPHIPVKQGQQRLRHCQDIAAVSDLIPIYSSGFIATATHRHLGLQRCLLNQAFVMPRLVRCQFRQGMTQWVPELASAGIRQPTQACHRQFCLHPAMHYCPVFNDKMK